MPTFEDWLNDPISIINNIYSSNKHEFDSKVKEYFETKLSKEKNYYSIPSLNDVPLHEIKPNSLVRYRCMVQDIFEPMYYSNVVRIRHTVSGDVSYMPVKYRENLDLPNGYELDGDGLREHLSELTLSDNGSNEQQKKPCDKNDGDDDVKVNLEQRVTLYCVPIPGENEWTKHAFKTMTLNGVGSQTTGSHSSTQNSINRASKRTMENDEEDKPSEEKENKQLERTDSLASYGPVICKETDTDTTTTVCKVCYKYKLHQHHHQQIESNGSDGKEIVAADEVREETEEVTNVTKKTRVVEEKTVETSATGKKWSRAELNFPLGEASTGHACLVRVYDDWDEYRLNETVEFIGILTQDPSLAYDEDVLAAADGDCWTRSEESVERRTDEKKTETTFKLVNTNTTAGDNDNTTSAVTTTHSDHYCRCDKEKELVDVSVVKEVRHSHTHKKLVMSAYPPSLVPRLHCLLSHKLPHNNPLLTHPWPSQPKVKINHEESGKGTDFWSNELNNFISTLRASSDVNTAAQMGSRNDPLNVLRKKLIDTLQELLLGDALAAEYLLMHLISSVFTRQDVTVLGKFTLNLTNVPIAEETKGNEQKKECIGNEPKNFSECFFEAIKQLVPTAHLFPLTTDSLNKSNLIPNKDYNKDKLITGMLQLPRDFHLCIDETVLNAGKLDQKGLLNLNSISNVIKWQKLDYDFSFNQQEFNTNIRVLTLSNGKSILPFDVQLKLDAITNDFKLDEYKKTVSNIFDSSSSSFLDNVRRYLTIVSRLGYTINERMQDMVQKDIVSMRSDETMSQGKGKISYEELHLQLVIARLQTVSYGKTELGLDEWNRAKTLNLERLKRKN